ncbi:DUF3147 family protein [Nonomuraea pusilla]|uniref:DUF3147 family protein n=1 Tax=Nonomuraea pusilla TaxID=46177 RepID=A0A1H7HYT2_9ACTN|nr:DUF3147 family protein [Nonomuraea pusilla]SEK55523.1 Protein of unknown function [Nonomuraea pusilla]
MSADDRIRVKPSKLRHTPVRGLVLRFVFGALVSVIAGVVGQRWGPLAGGVFLAFPAILGATLTLIEEEEHQRALAAQDAVGAVLGAVGMIAFAGCVWALAGRLPAPLVLGVATAAWALVAAILYLTFRTTRQ